MKIGLIQSPIQLKQAFSILEEAFVVEQKVLYKDEFGEFDQEAYYFLIFQIS